MDIKIFINDEEVEVVKGTSLAQIAKNYEDKFDHDIILAKVDGIYKELTETIKKPCRVEFLDYTERTANTVYVNGLVYITVYAYKRLFGYDKKIIVRHSLDKGLYIETENPINEINILNLEEEMKKVVSEAHPIEKVTVSRLEAMDYFKSINYKEKGDLLKYITATFVPVYKLDNLYDYFYSLMPINTCHLTDFGLTYINENGFVLRFPTIYLSKGVKEFETRTNVFNLYKESRKWAKNLGLENAADLNKIVENGEIADFIRMDEIEKNYELMNLAKKIVEKKDLKVVLLSGPSSTGKTTTTNKLKLCLKALGKKTLMISMDDFFVDREFSPRDEEGNYDFERFEALDLKAFDECMKKLVNKEEVLFPTYNFIIGKKEYKNKYKIDDNTIIVIEGIHALNPKFSGNLPKEKVIKIYLSALNQLNIDSHVRISTTDNRLLRRIVRDNRTRGNNVEDTLESWAKVRYGEENYIFPYQDEADYSFNTALVYELGVLKTFVEPLLYSVEPTSPYYNEAVRLINFLRIFLPISPESIPDDSIIREFIGGGCFKI